MNIGQELAALTILPKAILFTSTIGALPCVIANTAPAMTIRRNQVIACQWMAFQTMRLASLLGHWRFSTKAIFLVGHRLKMIGIYTGVISA